MGDSFNCQLVQSIVYFCMKENRIVVIEIALRTDLRDEGM